MNSTWFMRMIGSVIRVEMGPALWMLIIASILLVIAWIYREYTSF